MHNSVLNSAKFQCIQMYPRRSFSVKTQQEVALKSHTFNPVNLSKIHYIPTAEMTQSTADMGKISFLSCTDLLSVQNANTEADVM